MRIDNINANLASIFQTDGKQSKPIAAEIKKDCVEISADGLKKQSLDRAKKLQLIKKTDNQIYDQVDIRRKIVDKLIENKTFRQQIMNVFHNNKSKTDNSSPVRTDKVENARRKIEAGEYNQPEVVNSIIDKMMGKFLTD